MAEPATDTAPPDDVGSYLKSSGLMYDPAKIESGISGAMEQKGQITDQAVGNIEKNMQQRNAMMAKPIATPSQPHLQNVTQPPKPEFADPMQAFKSPAIFLAALGSLFTRRPLQTAMDSATGMINAFHKGDKEAMELQRQNWKDATEAAIKQNNIEIEKYKEAWENTKHSVAERQAKLNALAHGNQDEVTLAALKEGKIEPMLKLWENREKANQQLQISDHKIGDIIVKEKLKASAQQSIADQWKTDPDTIRVGEAIANYQQAPFTGVAARSPKAMAAMAVAYEKNPQYDQAKWTAHQSAERTFASGQESRMVRSLNVSIDHMETFDSLIDALQNKDISRINSLANRIAAETGNPAPTNFNLAKEIISKEIVKAIVAGGGGVGEREEMARLFSTANSPRQLKEGIITAKRLLAGQLVGLKKQYESTGGQNFDAKLTDEAKKQLETLSKPKGEWSVKEVK